MESKNTAVLIEGIYRRSFVDKIAPYKEQIFKQFNLTADIEKDGEGSNSLNRYKYFSPDRPRQIGIILEKCFPEIVYNSAKLNILDLGCGFGEFAAVFAGLGHNVIGINGGPTWYIRDFNFTTRLLEIPTYNFDILAHHTLDFLGNFDYCWASEILTLGTLQDKTDSILEKLIPICKYIRVVCHDNRQLYYDQTKYPSDIVKVFPYPLK